VAEVTISPARPADAEDIAVLLAELRRYYGATETAPLAARVRQVSEAVFASPPAAHVLLARARGALAGFAAYTFHWPAAGLARSLYLKELYVSQSHRRQGIGRLLMREIFQTATRHGCCRVEWTADTSNPPAQAFYDGLGVPVYPGKLFYRVLPGGTGFELPG
jgi:GNAT superfamily N-acetyltransferase